MKLWSSQQIPRFREIAEISLRHLSPTKVGGGLWRTLALVLVRAASAREWGKGRIPRILLE